MATVDAFDWLCAGLLSAWWLFLLCAPLQPEWYWWRLTRAVRRDMKIWKFHGPH